jgi:hypothetical protein
LLKKILDKNPYTLTSINTGNLESSYFIIKFKQNEILSAKTLALILKNVLQAHGVITNLRKGDTLIISADCALHAEKIKLLFAEGIKRESAITVLRKQVKQLLQACFMDPTLYLFISDKAERTGLPIAKIEFTLPVTAKDYRLQFIVSFIENELTFEEINDRISIIMTGASHGDEKQLAALCKQLTTAIQREAEKSIVQPPPIVVAVDSKEEKVRALSYRSSGRIGLTIIARMTTLPKQITLHRTIKWGNLIYDSSREDNTIYLLNTGQFHNFKTFSNSWHFVSNALVSNKKPMTDALFKAFHDQVTAPVLVSPEANQGFVLWKAKKAKDQNGVPFTTSLKVKILGVFGKGKYRAYTDQKTAEDGRAVLHTVRGVKLVH